MKNSTLFLMMVLVVICWFGIFKFSGMTVAYVNEPITYAGRNILVERVSSDLAIISVDGETDLFRTGDTKLINGIEITLSEVTYFSEIEDRKVELQLKSTTICSDGKCDLGEDPENCCIDCGCPADYECENNECVHRPPDQCQTDSDCDDLNMSTKDFCFGEPKTCHYQTILCHTDKTCDDNDPCTIDRCSFNDCIHEPLPDCTPRTAPASQPTEKQEGFFMRLLRKLFNIL